MESTLTDIGFEPDELDSIPVEELIEAESDILCSVAKAIGHISAYALSDIAASAQTSKTTQAELQEDEDDDDDPSQCHLYQTGTCKYMDKNFRLGYQQILTGWVVIIQGVTTGFTNHA